MLRGNTKKQLTYSHQNKLAYFHRKQFSYYPEKRFSYYPEKRFTYYHLIAIFVVGLCGGFGINNLNREYDYQKMLYSLSPEIANKTSVVKTSPSVIKIDEQKAFNLVWNLPQVQRKAKEIESLSQGGISVSAVVESHPSRDANFYIVRVFENHPDKTTSPVYWFRVSGSSGAIEPLDLVENKYIALEKWNPDGR